MLSRSDCWARCALPNLPTARGMRKPFGQTEKKRTGFATCPLLQLMLHDRRDYLMFVPRTRVISSMISSTLLLANIFSMAMDRALFISCSMRDSLK